MRYEVEEVCAFCGRTVRVYTVTAKPPGQVLITAHPVCMAERLEAQVEMQYAQDAIHGRTLEDN